MIKFFVQICFSLLCVTTLVAEGRQIPQGRIAGATDVKNGVVPYIVSIQDTFGFNNCAGAIIAEQWILTAAHCILWPVEYVRVATGSVNWTKPDALYKVEKTVTHCSFDKPLLANDIGLMKLDRPIVFNNHTQPIKMAQANHLKEGDKLLIAGWGAENASGPFPEILKTAEVDYLERKKCLELTDKPEFIHAGHICTDTKNGKGTCVGDSGGPITYDNNLLVGIVNFGKPCAVGKPDVYASVAYYYDWIIDILNGGTAC